MRLLLTVAHPDDEAFGCGSVLAHASAGGWRSVVVCATRGELGEAVGVDVGCEGGDRRARLGEIREAELRAATALLGVDRVEVLGLRDSGMIGDVEPGSLVATPAKQVADAIAAIIDDVRPDVVITLDGLDGHRDHAAVRDATMMALDTATWRPQRTYLWSLPRSLMSMFTGDADVGTPDDDITTVVDTTGYVDRRWRAMRAHASQANPYDAMAPDLQSAFLRADHFIRIDPPWPGGPIESDWRPAR